LPADGGRKGWFGDGSANKIVPHPVHGARFFLLKGKRKGKQQENGKPSSAHQERGELGALVRVVTQR
jgi:hypothetical protein